MHAANSDRVTYNLGRCADCRTFCTLELLRAFNFVISFYLLVSFEEIKETVAINGA